VGAKGWREVGSFDAPDTVELVTAMALGADQFVAVGTRYAAAQLSEGYVPPHEGRVWLSPDGATWEPLTSQLTFKDASLTSLVTAPDGSLIAFGSFETGTGSAPQLGIWRSHDARTWDRVDLGLPSDLQVGRVVHGAKGYLMDGYSSTHQMWLSADGLAWEPAGEVPELDLEPGSLRSFGAGDDGFVASFIAASGDVDVAIASADGREWLSGGAFPGYGAAVAPIGGDWIAVVVPGLHDLPVDLAVLVSANGLDWAETARIHDPEDRDTFGYVHGLVSAGGRVFLTVDLSTMCECPIGVSGGVWSSQDGITWEQNDTGADSTVVAGAEHDGTVVLAGYVRGRVTFWVNQRP
jgi:hypothetical protein